MSRAPTIFWFRRDLRRADNPALCEAALAGAGRVAGAFVVDPTFCAPAGPTRAAYLTATLEALDADLDGRLIVREGDPAEELVRLAREVGARQVVATADFAPAGRARDARVGEALGARGLDLRLLDAPYAVAPGTVTTVAGAPCRVFAAFRRGWEPRVVAPTTRRAPEVEWLEATSRGARAVRGAAARQRPWYFADLPDEAPATLAPAGEAAAHAALAEHVARVEGYAAARNAPGLDATSRLSAHLRFGTLHPRQVLAACDGAGEGRATFRAELCWREFYADVLYHRPDSARRVLQPALEHLRVDRDEAAVARFGAWARGETGYPLVDAGMRQLLAEGWMHNRVRMVCASFLVKHLHLDWRWGARWFMWRLIDGDLASNQHGWQWTAGTGTDAAPFHRVFNPTLQAERFDPEGAYVRRYVAELAGVAAPDCLRPGGGGLLAPGYPAPIVDAARERAEALARFAEARERVDA